VAAYAKQKLSLPDFQPVRGALPKRIAACAAGEWCERSKVVRYDGRGPTMPAGHRNAFLYCAPSRDRWTLCVLRWRLVPLLLRLHPAEIGPYCALPGTFFQLQEPRKGAAMATKRWK
jgi:hypothetical protein